MFSGFFMFSQFPPWPPIRDDRKAQLLGPHLWSTSLLSSKNVNFYFCLSSSVVFYNYEPATSMPTLIHLSLAPISFLSSQPPLIRTQASCNVRTHWCIISEMYIHIIFVFIKGTSILHPLKWTIAKTQRCIRSEMYIHIIIVLTEDTNILPLTWNGQY